MQRFCRGALLNLFYECNLQTIQKLNDGNEVNGKKRSKNGIIIIIVIVQLHCVGEFLFARQFTLYGGQVDFGKLQTPVSKGFWKWKPESKFIAPKRHAVQNVTESGDGSMKLDAESTAMMVVQMYKKIVDDSRRFVRGRRLSAIVIPPKWTEIVYHFFSHGQRSLMNHRLKCFKSASDH